MFIEQQISILELISEESRDTEVMMLKIQLCQEWITF